MPLDIQHVVGGEPKTISVYIEAANDSCTVTYDPTRYDWRIEQRMVEDSTRLPAGTIRDFVLAFVTEWDLTQNGEPIPVTNEGLDMVHFGYVLAPIANAIIEDMSEGKAPRTVSPQRSPTAMSRRSRSGAKAASPARL